MLAAAEDVLATEAMMRANEGRSLPNLLRRAQERSSSELATTGTGYGETLELAGSTGGGLGDFGNCHDGHRVRSDSRICHGERRHRRLERGSTGSVSGLDWTGQTSGALGKLFGRGGDVDTWAERTER
ncbi:hypothetical protein DVH05_026741 [Phytophthora capsici]|nr:hypothetical protein DVH05_026741 [Phytophthora capsici]